MITLWNSVCKLISKTYEQDSIGQQKEVEVVKEVYCQLKSVPQQEFFSASQTGIKASRCVIVRTADYNGETELRLDNKKKYSIYRTYDTKNECTELYCEVRAGE